LNEQDKEHEFDLKVCYVEIYNEIIRDPEIGITIAGVTEVKVNDPKDVMNLLQQGNKRRTTESTNANQTSSRSHVFVL
jgi:kinesin family member 18/19